MIHGRSAVQIAVAVLMSVHVYCSDMVKINNAADAMTASIVYLHSRDARNIPGKEVQWEERTIFSGGPGDLVTTSKRFTSGSWIIEIYQGLAPLRSTVYQITVFDANEGWYWKGNIKADGSISEEAPFKQLSLEEKQKMADELAKKSKNVAPTGGYGH